MEEGQIREREIESIYVMTRRVFKGWIYSKNQLTQLAQLGTCKRRHAGVLRLTRGLCQKFLKRKR